MLGKKCLNRSEHTGSVNTRKFKLIWNWKKKTTNKKDSLGHFPGTWCVSVLEISIQLPILHSFNASFAGFCSSFTIQPDVGGIWKKMVIMPFLQELTPFTALCRKTGKASFNARSEEGCVGTGTKRPDTQPFPELALRNYIWCQDKRAGFWLCWRLRTGPCHLA